MVTKRELKEGVNVFTNDLLISLFKKTDKRFSITETADNIGFSLFQVTVTLYIDDRKYKMFTGEDLDVNIAGVNAYTSFYEHMLLEFDFSRVY